MGFLDKNGDVVVGIHRARRLARAAAKLMQAKNQYNQLADDGFTSIHYRAAKYVRED